MTWNPRFAERSPMLWPLAAHAESLGTCAEWPRRDALQALVSAAAVTNAQGMPLRLVAPDADAGRDYEMRAYERGELEVREDGWHDIFNVLAWLAYPRTKAALNARHARIASVERACKAAPDASNRGRVRDALTVFDESGAIFAAADRELVDDLRAFRWKSLFWTKRERVREAVRVYVFGHGLFEKALSPYLGITAHAMPIVVDANFLSGPPARQLERIDVLAAQAVSDAKQLDTPQSLAPLPLLGVPGWWPDNEHEAFYDNTAYFRPGRRRSAKIGGECPG